MTDAPARTAVRSRETAETTVAVEIDLDGTGAVSVDTGIGFFDHMLTAMAVHGYLDLTVTCDGDLEVDAHHSVEDVALTLGGAVDAALGEKASIVRFAEVTTPLDEARATVVLDLSGRPYTVFEGSFSQAQVGAFPADLARHFIESFSATAAATVHASVEGRNAHHEVEALFKSLGRALDRATARDTRRSGPPSTKGRL
jgi:imidazoleglycerol-phosphate dehydratase (EC 4.2.1.19)